MQQKPDWIVSRLGKNVTPLDVQANGESLGNYEIRDPQEYWAKPGIAEKFNGDQDAFTKFYDKEVANFNGNLEAERMEAASPVVEKPLPQRGGSLDAAPVTIPLIQTISPDIEGRDFNWSRMGTYGPRQHSWREKAAEKVRTLDGEFITWDEFKKRRGTEDALAKFALNSDGSIRTSPETGGNGYLQELADGEELSSRDQVYSPNAHWWGLYGNSYGAKQFVGNLVGFLPQFGTSTMESLYTIGNLFTDDGSETNKFLNNRIQAMRYWNWGMTDEGMENMWGAEGITNLVLQGLAQLAGMKGIGTIGMGVAKSLGAGVPLAGKIGSVSGKGLMSLLVGGEAAKISREYGLSKDEAAMMTLITAAATYPLMGLSEYAINGSLGKAHNLVAVDKGLKQLGASLKSQGWTPKLLKTGAGRRATMMQLRAQAANMEANTLGRFGTAAVAEGIEEAAEEVVRSSVMGIHDLLINNNIGLDRLSMGTMDSNHNTFYGDNFEHFDWSRQWDQIAQAGLAGGIAGGFAGGLMKTLEKQAPQTYNHMFEAVLRGGNLRRDLFSYIDAMHKQGRLQSTIQEGDATETDNDTAYKNIKQVLENFASVVDKYNLGDVYSDLNTNLQRFVGVDLPKFLGDENLDHIAGYTSMTKDVKNLVREIEQIEGQVANMAEPNEELTNKLTNKKNELGRIVGGEHNKEYQEQLAFYIAQTRLQSDDSLLAPHEMIALNQKIASDYEYDKTKQAEELTVLQENNSKATLGEDLPIITPGRQQELQAEGKKAIRESWKAASENEEALSKFNFENVTKKYKLKGKTPLSLKGEAAKEFTKTLSQQSSEGFTTPQDEQLLEAMINLDRVNKAETKDPRVPELSDSYFKMLDKKPGEELSFTKEDIREVVGREIQATIAQVSDNGTSTYVGNEALLNQLESNVEARIEQLGKNRVAQELLDIDLDASLVDPQFTQPIEEQLQSLYRDVKALKFLSEKNKSNPEAIKKQLSMEQIGRVVGFLDQASILSQDFATQVNSHMPEITRAIEEEDVNLFNVAMVKLEDSVYGADRETPFIMGIVQHAIKEGNIDLATAIYAFTGMSGSEFAKVYQSAESVANIKPSEEQFNTIKDIVKSAVAEENFAQDLKTGQTSGRDYVVIDGAAGTGKTSVVLGYSAIAINNFYKGFGNEGKIALVGPKDGADKAQLLAENLNKNYTSEDIVMSQKDLLQILEDPKEYNKYNVLVADEVGLNQYDFNVNVHSKLQKVNKERSSNGMTPLVILASGDSQQVSSTSNGQTEFTVFDDAVFLAPKPKRMKFSFRGVNQALLMVEEDFNQLFDNVNHRFKQYVHNEEGSGVEFEMRDGDSTYSDRFVQKAKNFLDKAAERSESAVIISDATDLPAELNNYPIKRVKDAQGHEWDKVVFIPTSHDIRNPSPNEMYDRKAYYTALTRATTGVYALIDPQTGLSSKKGKVYDYDTLDIAPTVEEAKAKSDAMVSAASTETARPPKKAAPEVEGRDVLEQPNPQSTEPEVPTPELETVTSRVEAYLKEQFDNGALLNIDMTSNTDTGRRLTNIALYPEQNAEAYAKTEFFVTAAYPTRGRFNLPQGFSNADARAKDRPWFYLEAATTEINPETGKERRIGGTIGAIQLGKMNTDEGVAPLLEGIDITDEGVSFSIPKEMIFSAKGAKNPELIRSKENWNAPLSGEVRLQDLANNFPGMQFSRPMIADVDIFHVNGTGQATVKAGQAFIAVSMFHQSRGALESDLTTKSIEGNVKNEEYITYIPIDDGVQKRLTSQEREDLITRIMSEDSDDPRNLEKLNEALWNRAHNTTNKAHEGTNSRFTGTEGAQQALTVPLIDALNTIVRNEELPREVRYQANLMLPTVVKDYQHVNGYENSEAVSEETAAELDEKSYQGRRSLMLRALRHRQKRLAAERAGNPEPSGGNIEIVFDEVQKLFQQQRADYIKPQYVRGQQTDTFMWAALPKISTKENYSRMGQEYDESLYGDYGVINISHGLRHPHFAINSSGIQTEIKSKIQPTQKSIAAQSTKKSSELSDIEISAPDIGLTQFRNLFYPGPNSSLVSQGINHFRRLVTDRLYVTNAANPGVRNLDETLKDLRQELKEKSEGKEYPSTNLWQSPAHVKMEYHEWVAGKQFDFLLNYTYPSVTFEDGEYKNVVSHKEHSGIGSKEESALGENTTAKLKTLIYSTPVLVKDGEGYQIRSKVFNSTSTIDRSYLNMEDTPTIIDLVYETMMSTDNPILRDPSVSTRTKIRTLLEETAGKSRHVDSLYRRYFSPEPFTVNGEEQISFASMQDAEAQRLTDAVSIFLLSNLNRKFYTVNVDKNNSLPFSSQGRASLEEFTAEENMRAMVQPGARQIRDFDNKKKTFTLNSINFNLSNPDKTQLVALFKNLGYSMDMSVLNTMLSGKNENQVLNKMTKQGLSIVRSLSQGNVPSRPSIGQDIAAAIAEKDGFAFRNYIKNADGEKVYTLQKRVPVMLFESNFNTTILEENLFNPSLDNDWKIVDFVSKQGFTNDEGNKVSTNDNLLQEESLMYDLHYGFLNPISRVKKADKNPVVIMPYVEYADAGSNIVPAMELRKNIRKDSYVDEVFKDYIDSRRAYLNKLEQSILGRWSAFGIEAKSLEELDSKLGEVDLNSVEQANLIRNLDYVVKDDKARIKPSLLADLASQPTKGSFKKYVDKIKNLTKELPAKELDKLNKAAKDLGGLDQAIEKYYFTWLAASYNLKNATTGPEYQYKGDNETAESIDLVKRAKLLVSPSTAMLFRGSEWTNGVEAEGPVRVSLKTNKVNGVELTPEQLHEGYKMTEMINIAVVQENPAEVQLTSKSAPDEKEAWDGATFVTPLTRIFQKASQGGDAGTAITSIMKNVTHHHGGDHVKGIKNAEYEITPEILKVAHPKIKHLFEKSLEVDFTNNIKVGQKEASNALQVLTDILGVKKDYSNLDDQHFIDLAKYLVLSGNQNNFITEIVPVSSMKMGLEAVNPIDAESLTPTVISQRHKGTQLNAIKDLDKKKAPTVGNQTGRGLIAANLSSQILSELSINAEPQAVASLRESQTAIAQTVMNTMEGISGGNFSQKFISTLNEDAKGLLDLKERLKSLESAKNLSLSDKAIFNLFYPVFVGDFGQEAIAPKTKGMELVLHPADGIIDASNFRTAAENKKLGDATKLRYSEPTIKGVPISQIPEYQELTTTKEKHNWLQKQEGLEEGFTEVILSRKLFPEWDLKDKQPHQLTASYFSNEVLKAGIKKLGLDINMTQARNAEELDLDPEVKEQLETLVEESKVKGAEAKARFDQAIQGILTRTPATGPHSTSAIKPIGFIDDSDNAVFVPAEVNAVSGSDYDIDKKTLSMYIVDKSTKKILFPEDLTKSASNNQIIAAHKNNIVRRAVEIMSNAKNSASNQMSVDDALDQLKEFVKNKKEVIEHNDLAGNWKTHEENYVGKGLIGIFANTQKVYNTLYEYYKFNSNEKAPIAGTNTGFNEIWTKIGALINAGTDTVKNRILGPLGVTAENADLVSYMIMTGKSYDEIFGPKGILQEKPVKKYFEELRKARMYYSETTAEEVRKKFIPKKHKELITNARVIGQFARLIPNTKDSIPSSMEGSIKFLNSFKSMMKEAGVQNFNLFDYLGSTSAEKAKISSQVESVINPLEVIEGLPHLKAMYETLYRMHLKMEREIPMYKYLYNSGLASKNYRATAYRLYQGAAERYLATQDITSSQGHDLGLADGRIAFLEYMHGSFFNQLQEESYYGNKFVANLKKEVFEIQATGEQAIKLVMKDLKQLSEQVQSEIQGGFEQLSDSQKQDLFQYSLITNGLAETRDSFSALFSMKDRASWFGFLNSKLDQVFSRFQPSEIGDKISNAARTATGNPLAINYELNIFSSSLEDSMDNFTLDGNTVTYFQLGKAFQQPVEIFKSKVIKRIFDKGGEEGAESVEALRKIGPRLGMTTEQTEDLIDYSLEKTANMTLDQRIEHRMDVAAQMFLGKNDFTQLNDSDLRELERINHMLQNLDPTYRDQYSEVKSVVKALLSTKKQQDTYKKAEERNKFCDL